MTFQELGLSENILKAIKDCGYETPTPIQAQAIPHVLMMRDVVGLAQTGTGKTASFTLPMIEILSGGRARARMPRSLVLTPTRELAAQVAENFEMYGKYTKLEMALLTGGTSMEEQIKKLDRGVDVLIATPGRLLDLFERGKVLLTGVNILVIDEADRMLDMGFIPDIEKIVSKLSPMRQTLLFSATMPPEIRALTQKFQNNPREVSVAPPATTVKNVKEYLVWTTRRDKNRILHQIIKTEDVRNAFVFCNRKRDIDGVARFLEGKGLKCGQMHGDMSQPERTKTLDAFKSGAIAFLVCSDVAGRGIDVDDVSHVLNYDVPMHSDDYVHRIGRTARAGRQGCAYSLATPEDEKFVDAIESLIKNKINVVDMGGQKPDAEKKSGDRKPAAKKAVDKTDKKVAERKTGETKQPHQKESRPKENLTKENPKKEAPKKDVAKQEDHSKDDNPYMRHDDQAVAQKNYNQKNISKNQNQSDNRSHAASKNQSDDQSSVLGFGNDIPNFFQRAS